MISLHRPTHRSTRTPDSISLAWIPTRTLIGSGHYLPAHRAETRCWTTGRDDTPAYVCTASICAKHSATGIR